MSNDSRFPKRKPVDMNINKFKKMLDDSDLVISRGERSRLIKQYKQKAWSEFDRIVTSVGPTPTRNQGATSGE